MKQLVGMIKRDRIMNMHRRDIGCVESIVTVSMSKKVRIVVLMLDNIELRLLIFMGGGGEKKCKEWMNERDNLQLDSWFLTKLLEDLIIY